MFNTEKVEKKILMLLEVVVLKSQRIFKKLNKIKISIIFAIKSYILNNHLKLKDIICNSNINTAYFTRIFCVNISKFE